MPPKRHLDRFTHFCILVSAGVFWFHGCSQFLCYFDTIVQMDIYNLSKSAPVIQQTFCLRIGPVRYNYKNVSMLFLFPVTRDLFLVIVATYTERNLPITVATLTLLMENSAMHK